LVEAKAVSPPAIRKPRRLRIRDIEPPSQFEENSQNPTVEAAAFQPKPTSWHISVAAEAIAAAQFARCGFDVSVQYGADQPEYDLIVAKGDHLLKVSVKGSRDWGGV
jgi:hypothetical protein